MNKEKKKKNGNQLQKLTRYIKILLSDLDHARSDSRKKRSGLASRNAD